MAEEDIQVRKRRIAIYDKRSELKRVLFGSNRRKLQNIGKVQEAIKKDTEEIKGDTTAIKANTDQIPALVTEMKAMKEHFLAKSDGTKVRASERALTNRHARQ